MNTPIIPYHFTKNIGRGFSSFFNKVIQQNGVVCFDLEDSINAENPDNISFFKNSHRTLLFEKLRELPEILKSNKIGFRVNQPDSLYYTADLMAISTLELVNCVFLPKVESPQQVLKLLKELPETVQEIIPIIETKEGLENIAAILTIIDPRFLKFAFGHCDFNLSNGYFPYFHQNSREYWDWISKLDYFATLFNKQLINSPVLDLENSELFSMVLKKTREYKAISGQVTLCLKQTSWCSQRNISASIKAVFPPQNSACRNDLAREIINRFDNFKMQERYFALDENRKLISPHEYESAKSVLKEILV